MFHFCHCASSLSRIVIWGCCFCSAGPRSASMLRCTCVLLYIYIYIHILWESLGFTDCVYVAMLHYINLYQYLWLSMSKIVRVCVCVCVDLFLTKVIDLCNSHFASVILMASATSLSWTCADSRKFRGKLLITNMYNHVNMIICM